MAVWFSALCTSPIELESTVFHSRMPSGGRLMRVRTSREFSCLICPLFNRKLAKRFELASCQRDSLLVPSAGLGVGAPASFAGK